MPKGILILRQIHRHCGILTHKVWNTGSKRRQIFGSSLTSGNADDLAKTFLWLTKDIEDGWEPGSVQKVF